MTDIRFIGEEYDGAEEDLGEFENTVETIVCDHAFGKFGKSALKATDIKIVPTVFEEPFFVIAAWHQTAGDKPARLQYHDLSIKLKMFKEDVFAVTDDKHEYRLTTRETLLLSALGGLAAINSLMAISKIKMDEE